MGFKSVTLSWASGGPGESMAEGGSPSLPAAWAASQDACAGDSLLQLPREGQPCPAGGQVEPWTRPSAPSTTLHQRGGPAGLRVSQAACGCPQPHAALPRAGVEPSGDRGLQRRGPSRACTTSGHQTSHQARRMARWGVMGEAGLVCGQAGQSLHSPLDPGDRG